MQSFKLVFMSLYCSDLNEPPSSPCIGTNWQITEAAAPGTIVSTPLMANDTDEGQVLVGKTSRNKPFPIAVIGLYICMNNCAVHEHHA